MDQFAYNVTTREVHWLDGLTKDCNIGFVAEDAGNIRKYAYLTALKQDHPRLDFCGHCFRSRSTVKKLKPAKKRR